MRWLLPFLRYTIDSEKFGARAFLYRLLEKVFKTDCMARISAATRAAEMIPKEEKVSIVIETDDSSASKSSIEEDTVTIGGVEEDSAAMSGDGTAPLATVTLDGENPSDDASVLSYDGDPDEDNELEQLPDDEDQQWSTPMEDKQMEKARVYYIYKRHTVLEEAIARHDPISGIIIQAKDGSPQMYLIYKVPGKKFGWKKVSFNDAEGTHVCGLWYAPITVEEVDAPPSTTTEITKLAKLATVAVPLRYPVGDTHPDGLKYCVITNWWRERNEKGQYVLPSLAFEVYQE